MNASLHKRLLLISFATIIAITGPDFKIGTSGDERFSVIVEGTYDGHDFRYRSNENMEQEHELDDPLILEDGTDSNVTLSVDLSTWFVDEQGKTWTPITRITGMRSTNRSSGH